MTCQEVRFIPVRFKDAYGPVGAWFLLFKSRAISAVGGEYMVVRKEELNNWAPYGLAKPIPANLRNYLGMLDVDQGLGPLYMETDEAINKIADAYKDDPKGYKKKMKELEAEAWEDFLDMTISQAHLWAALNVKPEEKHSEIAACEPYFIGSHSGASGAWVSGPEDLDTPYKWGYSQMTTVDGLLQPVMPPVLPAISFPPVPMRKVALPVNPPSSTSWKRALSPAWMRPCSKI
jgi:adenylylsulfate reductase subunit A